ncbi:unnamed protein product [Lactuca saligna]|uniref:Transposase (putative) gypsy type domain-containing protein n=1 Tax=Lactuca saligna TaxID=75948 RepID=A0AA35YI90_LACSI|nr:unnamed protein product [Lactuca saligna]
MASIGISHIGMLASTRISHIRTVKSKLTIQTIYMLIQKYNSYPKFNPRLPEANDAITDAPEGFVGVYRVFFKSGLHLPAFDFLKTVLDYYGLHIAQITPNIFHKILFLTLLCVALDVSSAINIFCHFYILMSNGDWVSFSICDGLVDICDGLPTSMKYWK